MTESENLRFPFFFGFAGGLIMVNYGVKMDHVWEAYGLVSF